MKHLKKVLSEEEYSEFLISSAFVLSNVTKIVTGDGDDDYLVKYNPNNVAKYLSVLPLRDGTITITIPYEMQLNGRSVLSEIYYSVNHGQTWRVFFNDPAVEGEEEGISTTIAVSAMEKVFFKSTGVGTGINGAGASITSDIPVILEGNIMSMIYGDDFAGHDTFNGGTYNFYGLFSGLNVISARDLCLPATALTTGCYYRLFQGCSLLREGPVLPAKTLAAHCYREMFHGCSLLNDVTCLATDISASNSLTNWLYGVAATGTFIKADGMDGWPSGVNGIPNGWTVYVNNDGGEL